ncbi:hypothetical protein HMPREF9530_03564 [Escherichia coli MS 21-1]|nr:hypothetical protein HMPREF9530_03564 [Escherichia coli MS 21-1]
MNSEVLSPISNTETLFFIPVFIQFINVKCVHWAIFITMQPHNRCSLTQVLMKPR